MTRNIELCLRFAHIRERGHFARFAFGTGPNHSASFSSSSPLRWRLTRSHQQLYSKVLELCLNSDRIWQFNFLKLHTFPASPLLTPTAVRANSVHLVSSINDPIFLIPHLKPHLLG